MKVLFLGPSSSDICGWLMSNEDAFVTGDKITMYTIDSIRPDFVVSHGYRHIIPPVVTRALDGHAVNVHISYLPWNRGADPNLWSWLEDTPKGVTIHCIDDGIDTGDVLVRRTHDPRGKDIQPTLRTTYAELQRAALQLFSEMWKHIKTGKCTRFQQDRKAGSYHRARDKKRVDYLLDMGWDTPISSLTEYAEDAVLSRTFWDAYDAAVWI